MTVSELIAKLQQFDPNEQVCADTEMGATDIDDVILVDEMQVSRITGAAELVQSRGEARCLRR